MLISKGYFITQRKNKLIINLPQTMETLNGTNEIISDRKLELNDDELSVLLSIVIELFENKER